MVWTGTDKVWLVRRLPQLVCCTHGLWTRVSPPMVNIPTFPQVASHVGMVTGWRRSHKLIGLLYALQAAFRLRGIFSPIACDPLMLLMNPSCLQEYALHKFTAVNYLYQELITFLFDCLCKLPYLLSSGMPAVLLVTLFFKIVPLLLIFKY